MNLGELNQDNKSTLIKLNLDIKTLYFVLTLTDELNIDSQTKDKAKSWDRKKQNEEMLKYFY